MAKKRVMSAAVALSCAAILAACTSGHPSADPQSQVKRSPATTTQGASTDGYTVTKRDLTVTYKLRGFSQASAYIGLPSAANLRFDASIPLARAVSIGEPIGRLVPDGDTLAALRRVARDSTVARSQLEDILGRERPVVAHAAGTLASKDGRPILSVVGLDATVAITPLQYLRYHGFEFMGKVSLETVFGQRTTECVSVWLEAPGLPTATDSGEEHSGGKLHCRIPPDVETAAGLPVTVTLTSRPLKDAVAVPAIYVGLDKTGLNYVVNVHKADGTLVERPVVVGPSDGVVRVITDGLAVGETVVATGT